MGPDRPGDRVIFLDRRRLRGVSETLSWLAGRRRRVRVVGDSMLPTLTEGQYVLVDPTRSPDPGELALARHPHRDDGLLVIKRVAARRPDGSYELISDNPDAGTDSRTWGPVPADMVDGTVTLCSTARERRSNAP